jgi:hydrogenase/urease accessory protein HupE
MTARAAFLRRLLAALLMAVLLPLAGTLQAHEMSMAELNLRELSKGEFIWSWGQSGKGSRPIAADLTPVWPEGCKTEEQSLRCTDAHGLSGRLAVNGVGKAYSAAMVRIVWLDGQERVYTITAAQPSVTLYGAANDERGADEIVRAYTMLGIEHILSGYDHLLFVFSLLFLVGFNRRLVYTITAFTAAHSITLASSALGLLTLRSAPVEASIALSIMLVAVEALNDRDKRTTLARRWPAFVSFLFGLVHGLGFAGALKEIGLPEQHMSIALLTFNVGVEIGQLLMVGLAFGLVKLLGRQSWFVRLRRPALYGIGIIASYWSLARLVAMLA